MWIKCHSFGWYDTPTQIKTRFVINVRKAVIARPLLAPRTHMNTNPTDKGSATPRRTNASLCSTLFIQNGLGGGIRTPVNSLPGRVPEPLGYTQMVTTLGI